MTKITAKTIAARTGYSVSAVSRAFRPGSPLASDKRARILAVAKELGYSGPAARFSDGNGQRTVALVIGDMSNPFYPATVDVLSSILLEDGVRMIFHTIPDGYDVDDVMGQVLDYRADGAIIASAGLSSRLAAECRAGGIPVVHYNRVQADRKSIAVCCDNYGGARSIADYLVSRGRTRFGFMGGRPDTSTHLERSRGFIDALAEAGHGVAATAEGQFHYQAGLAAAEKLFAVRPRIDALFCCNDVMALAAMDVAKRLGVRVPEDVAIVGFDDIPMAAWESYDLTTVRQPVRRMLRQAVEMIFGDVDEDGQIRIFAGELKLRSSA